MLEHGGALRAAALRYRIPLNEWLDLSTGINPHAWPVPPLPPRVWQRLPEADDALAAVAAAYYSAAHALPTAGSQAALQALPLLRAPGAVGMLHPGYAEHRCAWQRAGHQVELLSVAELESAVERVDVLLLIHPNNPTGQRFAPQMLRAWHQHLAARGGWLVLDEAFMDATPQSSLAADTHLPGLVVLRSLGKFFGLAGARVGFMLAEPGLLALLQGLLGPWTVNGAARWVAIQALQDREWQAQMRKFLPQAAQRLADLLERYAVHSMGGSALFQWVECEDAAWWQEALAQHGILVRCFTDPPGLRFGLPGTELEWRRLEQALNSIRAIIAARL